MSGIAKTAAKVEIDPADFREMLAGQISAEVSVNSLIAAAVGAANCPADCDIA
jgi:hypothetical protein